ncbi:MAG: hypothetical protein KAT34_05760 [Candidatus Aminicenantes bacterium]|nr:hypothetical protein [Candidatus Aminicenantes bacterium]
MKDNIKTGKQKTTGEENRKKNFYILIFFLCVLLTIVLVLKKRDGGEKEEKQKVEITKEKVIPLKITDLIIEPDKPTAAGIIRVIPVLKKKPRGKFIYKYRWFVNGEEILTATKSLLPEKYRVKNNRVYCRVKAVKDNVESKEKKSKTIVIANSPPVVRHRPVQNFSVPGDFYHQIDAYDPDGDALEFNLVAPLGMGVELDSGTGEIRWSIPPLPREEEKPAERVTRIEGEENQVIEETERAPEKTDRTRIVIFIEVRDTDGAITITGINLDLRKGREIGV